MYQEDYLLRIIERFVAAIANLAEDPAADEADFDNALSKTLGLSITLLDLLSPRDLAAMVRKGDAHDPIRIESVAAVLSALAERGGPAAQTRARKAAELRRHHMDPHPMGNSAEA